MEEITVRISELPGADPLSGIELVPLVQNGTTKIRTVQSIVLEGGLQDHIDVPDPHPQYAFRVKNNLTATTDPTANDDVTQGYEPTSRWVNTVTEEFFICVTNTAGNANWQQQTLTLDELGSAALVDVGLNPVDVPQNQNLGTAAYKDDGSGNGLNADLLDGLQASQFVRSDTNDTMTGNLTISNGAPALSLTESDRPSGENQARFITTRGVLYIQGTTNGLISFTGLNGADVSKFDVKFNGDYHDIWHEGNDGAGSGLDADLLDGEHGSYYLNFNNFTNVPSFDNYNSWNLMTEGTLRSPISSGENVNFISGLNTTIDYNATNNTITVNSTDTNNYLESISFNTSNGILTAAMNGLPSRTVDLDGRYLQLGGTDFSGEYPATFNLNGQIYSNPSITYNGLSDTLVAPNFSGNGSGLTNVNAATATKLATSRSITLSGDLSGSANFDGSSNIVISANVADDSHNHTISNIDGLQTALNAKDNYGGWVLNTDGVSRGTITSNETVRFNGGSNVTLGYSSSNNTITISAIDTNTTYSAGTGLSLVGTQFSVTNPFNPSGTYASLRAQATTKADVGLGNVRNVASYSQTEADSLFASESDMLGGSAQSWQNVLASRSPNVVYTNTTGRPIMVSIIANSTNQPVGSSAVTLKVDGVVIAHDQAFDAAYPASCVSAIVPNNSTYEVTSLVYDRSASWFELR